MSNLPSSVICSSSLLAYYLFNVSNQPSDTYGLIFGSHATRFKRDIEDGREFSHTEEATVIVEKFVFYDISDENQRLFDFAYQINRNLIAEQCSLEKANGDASSNIQLIGWFAFNRSWHERFLSVYEQVSENMIADSSCKRPLLFVQAYDRIIGADSKMLGVNETNIRAFVFDESDKTLKPVDFKFTNVGDTSHKEYTEVLERRLASSNRGDLLSAYFEKHNVDDLPAIVAMQTESLLTAAKRSLINRIDQICLEQPLRELMSTSAELAPPAGASSYVMNGCQPSAASFLKTPNLIDSSPSSAASSKLINLTTSDESIDGIRSPKEQSKFLITPAMAPHPQQPLAPVSLTNGSQKRESKLTDGIHSGSPALDEVCDSISMNNIPDQFITTRSTAASKRAKNEEPSFGKGRGQKK